jgi:hypothetical protein
MSLGIPKKCQRGAALAYVPAVAFVAGWSVRNAEGAE